MSATPYKSRIETRDELTTALNACKKEWEANTSSSYRNNHHGRALEEAIQSNKAQWPLAWEGKNPLSGGQTFESMTPTQRVCIPKTAWNA